MPSTYPAETDASAIAFINRRVVVAGAGLAGLRTAEELRRAGHRGEIVMIGAEPHLPYDRPPLSKDVIRGVRDTTTLRPEEFHADNEIEVRLGTSACGVDTDRHVVHLECGTDIGYDDLVVATGLRSRRLTGIPPLRGVHTLRSLDDALSLRSELKDGMRALVVGAGFIGCELAASFRDLGLDVVLVDVAPTPLSAVLGDVVGRLVQRLHEGEGVDVRGGVGLNELLGSDRVTGAVLTDGSRVPADVVVLGVGSQPVTEWLTDTGIELAAPLAGGGVLADGCGRTSAEHVWAIGDVAAWRHPAGHHRRVEHWSNAGEQAKVLANALLGGHPSGIAGVPFFWSDQYGLKLQAVGTPSAGDTVHLILDDGRNFLACYESGGRLSAAVGAGLPREVMKLRAGVAAALPIAEVLASSSGPGSL